MLTGRPKVIKNFGIMTWLWLSMGALFALFSFIANINNDVQLKTAEVFSFLYLFCFILLLALPQMDKFRNRMAADDGSTHFWLQDVSTDKLWWIGIGLIGVFASSYLTASLNVPIIGIFASGIFMMIAFLRTKSILIPIMIHGIYNAVVILLQSGLVAGSFFAQSAIQTSVPIIGISNNGLPPLASEMIFQFLLVATAEELLKVLVISFFVVNVKGGFNPTRTTTWIAALVSVGFWTILHAIQALPNALNFIH